MRALRRAVGIAGLSVLTSAGVLAMAEQPASAAGPWYVAPAPTGNNGNSCLSAAAPCLTIAGVLANPGFVSGDTINVAAGTYAMNTNALRPMMTTKGAVIEGAGQASTILNGANAAGNSIFTVNGAGVGLTLRNLTVRDGRTGTSALGAGVLLFNGSLATEDVTFLSNENSALGGAVFVHSGMTYNATRTTFTGNATSTPATSTGGAIYVNTGGTLNVGTSSFSTNSAPNGGAIFAGAGTNVSISDTGFTGNAAPFSSGTSGIGGALYLANTGTTATLTNNTFTGNSAGLAGGAVTLLGATAGANVTGGSIATNTNSFSGGGVYSTGVLGLSGTSVTANSAPLGGGIAVAGGTTTLTGGTYSNNTGGAGGAVLVNGGTLNQSGGTYNANTAGNGGAVSVIGATPTVPESTATFTGGTSFTNNKAVSTAAADTGNGGAIYNSGSLSATDAIFTSNAVDPTVAGSGSRRGYGGSVFNGPTDGNDAPDAVITDATFSGAPPSPLLVHAVVGGVIANTNFVNASPPATAVAGELDLVSSTVSGGKAYFGGGLFSSGTVDVTGGALSGNTALPLAFQTTGSGGGAWVTGVANIDGTTVSGNVATGDAAAAGTGLGGGVYGAAGSVLTVTDASVTDNTATASNAASTGAGGGIYAAGTSLAIDGSTIAGNTAVQPTASSTAATTGVGGGVVTAITTVAAPEPAAPPITISGSAISGNQAIGGAGANSGIAGGLLQISGTSRITSTAIDDNDASVSGGGFYNLLGTVSVEGGSISGNDAVAGGGLVNVGATTVDATTVAQNEAASAGGIFNLLVLDATDLELADNTATAVSNFTGFGGGLYNGGQATLTGGSIDGNTADPATFQGAGIGGGAYNSGAGAALTLSKVRVTGNEAVATTGVTGFGGGVYNAPGAANEHTTVVADQSTFDDNTAAFGSAIFGIASGTGSTAKTSIRRSTLSGNDATAASGGTYLGSTGSSASFTESTVTDNTKGITAIEGGTVSISGSIVFDNDGPDCATGGTPVGTITSGGHNLAAAGDTSCFGAGDGNVFGDPLLGALALNGGTTPNHLPNANNSPALDKIAGSTATGQNDAVSGNPITLCPPAGADQRGFTRPAGANCDIGSVEVGQNAPTISGPVSGTFVVGQQGELDGFEATGNPTPTFSSPNLPAGLVIQSTGPGTAKIEGTPDVGTTGVHTVTITALNEAGSASMDVELTINQAPSIAGPDTIHLIETVPGSADYLATGAPTPTLTLAEAPDSLPAGVTFTQGPGGAGTIGGTPVAGTAGSYTVTLTADNDVEPNATKLVTIEVVPVLTITTTSLPNGSHGHAYNATVAAIGGTQPYLFSLDGGSLPAGLSLASNGAITGTPTGLPGTSNFTVKVVDATDPQQTDTQELSITIGKGATSLDMGPVILDARNLLGIKIRLVYLTSRLTVAGTDTPIPGQVIVYKAGNTTVCSAVTNSDGVADCTLTFPAGVLAVILNFGASGTFAETPVWLGSTDSAGLIAI